ncbi:MAG: hypothetical protein KC468_24400 [Myxococcales bacterium]|nr:hypothetical protein [Myxococcales bacterium]
MHSLARTIALLSLLPLASCSGDDPPDDEGTWELVHAGLPGALLSVWGTSATDVWAVGGDTRDGMGPLVVHFDGAKWERVATGEAQGSLWWVFGFEGGPLYMGGDGGVILRYEGGAFTRMTTPGVATVFGIWGASPDDVWAVGGASDSTGGFAWRLSGDAWVDEPTLPVEIPSAAAIWKLYGTARDDAWLVGSNGVALHWDGAALTPGDTGVGSSLFTVHERDGRYAAVGGLASGIIVENDGAGWQNMTPEPAPMGLTGVTLGADGAGVAVGTYGVVLTRTPEGWAEEDLGFSVGQNLHGSWIDDEGGVWLVGGETFTLSLTDGVLLHYGQPIPSEGL